MNNHYIPCLLLKQFAEAGKANVCDLTTTTFSTRKIKKIFADRDLFDPELETLFAEKLEGPFGDLMNHKLLHENIIKIDRRENLLIRKFLLIHSLRAPIRKTSWDEMIKKTRMQNHPYVHTMNFILSNFPELKKEYEKFTFSSDIYIPDLKRAMAIDSIEEMANPGINFGDSPTLEIAARYAMAPCITFWDSSECGQEFILPKLPGISLMDQMGTFFKFLTIRERRVELEKIFMPDEIKREFDRLEYGSIVYYENFSVYPLSPTRALICFSPYFRLFFAIRDLDNRVICPPLLQKEQFDLHFFEPMRMELFEPCRNRDNRVYQYSVKQLTAKEVLSVNAMLLDTETEEFVFHDFNRIRDSFWYYDKMAKFELGKKHNFSHLK
jgi:hypothetical protein